MNILKAYTTGCKTSLQRPKMVILIYVVNLILGLSVALPFFFSFKDAIGSSISSTGVSKFLDLSTVSELIKFQSWNVVSLLDQCKWTIILFWVLAIFLTGGVIRCYNKEEYSASTFFSGAGVNFFRFLAVDLIMLLVQIVSAAIIYGFTYFLLTRLFDNIITEKPIFWGAAIAVFLHCCVLILFLMVSDYAKFRLEMNNSIRVLNSIFKAISYVFGNFVRTYFLYFLLLVIPIAVFVLYRFTLAKVPMMNWWGIAIMILVQQFFVLLRVWFRMWHLASEFEMYADDYKKEISYEIDPKDFQKNDDDDNVTIKEVVETVITYEDGTKETRVDLIEKKAKKDSKEELKDGQTIQVVEVVEQEIKEEIINQIEENKEEIKEEIKEEVKEEVKDEVKDIVKEVKEEVKDIVKEEIKEEVKDQIKDEVKDELIVEIKEENKEVAQDENKDNKKEIVVEIKEDVKEEIIQDIKEEINQENQDNKEVVVEINQELSQEAKEDLKEEIKEEVKEEIVEQVVQEVKEEVVQEVKEEVVQEVKEEVAQEVKEEIQSEPSSKDYEIVDTEEELALQGMGNFVLTDEDFNELGQDNDGSDSDITLEDTEVVPESELDGYPTDIQSDDERFVDPELADLWDPDPDSPAFG